MNLNITKKKLWQEERMVELLLEKGDVKLLMATLVTLLDMKYITEPKMIDKYKKLLKKLQETTA